MFYFHLNKVLPEKITRFLNKQQSCYGPKVKNGLKVLNGLNLLATSNFKNTTAKILGGF